MPRIKKEDVFYEQLEQLSDTVLAAAEEYASIMREYPESAPRIPRMKLFETQSDEQVAAIHKGLYTSFITPFDREDISALALAMDDIVDFMETLAARLDLFNISEVRPEAVEMAEITLKAVRELHEMMSHFHNFAKDETVMEKAIEIGRIQDVGDEVYRNALYNLFHEDHGGKTSVAWLRIFDRMEHGLAACDHTAAVVRTVIMKNA